MPEAILILTARITWWFQGYACSKFWPSQFRAGSTSALPPENCPTPCSGLVRYAVQVKSTIRTPRGTAADISRSLCLTDTDLTHCLLRELLACDHKGMRWFQKLEGDIISCQATNAQRGISVTKCKRDEWQAETPTSDHRATGQPRH